MTLTIQELAQKIGAQVQGDSTLQITGCAALDQAEPNEISFLANRKYIPHLRDSRAGAVIIAQDDADLAGDRTRLIAEDPYYAFREAMVALVGFRQHPDEGISDKAIIADSAHVGRHCYIGPYAVVGENVEIGDNCVIYPHCYIGNNAVLGDGCVLYPNVTIYNDCVLHDRVTLHAGCSIGQDGFGYATSQGIHQKIPLAGNAVIESDGEMGAHCSVDRATLGSTVIGAGSKFSNSVTIGHGSRVGKHNLFVAQVGLAGSVQTGNYVVMGGQVGVAGHLKIGDQTQIAAKSGVAADLKGGTKYGGAPAVPLTDAKRQLLSLARIPDLVSTIRRLEKRLARLEEQLPERSDAANQ